MKLYLSIGFPRTGTTSLQHWLFSKQNGFLGKIGGCEDIPNPSFSNKFSKEFTKIVCSSAFLENNEINKLTDLWLKKIIDANSNQEKLIISDEGLSSWSSDLKLRDPWPTYKKNPLPKNSSFPIIQWLKATGIKTFQKENIKINVTVRSRANWFTSLYAKESSKFLLASQKHFEIKVNEVIKNNNPHMKWGVLLNDLISILGKENVLITHYENLFSESKNDIKKIVDFFDLDMPFEEIEQKKSQKLNNKYLLRRFPTKVYNRIQRNVNIPNLGFLQSFEEFLLDSILSFLGREDYILCTEEIERLFSDAFMDDENLIASIEKQNSI